MTEPPASRRVALVTLGCARNEVDSEELAGRLAADGWTLVADPGEADVALVNTCGFVESAKKDSIDALLEAADLKDGRHRTSRVVAVGCLAERYGQTLAADLPEADAVLGFDAYAGLSAHLDTLLAGEPVPSHAPADRRALLPLTPVSRPAAASADATPGHTAYRRLLEDRPWAPLKIASGCDRRCAFCAIPAFRGAFVSRSPQDVLAEARWLAGQGVRELLLVSENSTSYGKDLGDLAALEKLLPPLAAVEGIARVRVSYLQPAEIRPGLLDTMASTPGIAPYYDLSFQHAAPGLLRRMRRFGGTEDFLDLLARIRAATPHAGIRSNVIVGFPGETEGELGELELFLAMARLDVVGVFGYSDEEGTEAAGLPGKLPEEVVAARVRRVGDLVEALTTQRAEERIGEAVTVLVEEVEPGADPVGRTETQGPEVDGVTVLVAGPPGAPAPRPGDLVPALVVGSEGVDLHAEARAPR
jgi:ribosomal protein S12 methylthiotransferase